MEITAFDFTLSQSFLIASSLTLLSLLLAFLTLRSKSPKPDLTVHSSTSAASTTTTIACRCCCSCNGEIGSVNSADSFTAEEKHLNGGGAAEEMVVEKQSGASMMEQLVPEITTHALSYLDYPSLCRLSMTNSLMRKAANDDNAWKALYHKVFVLFLLLFWEFILMFRLILLLIVDSFLMWNTRYFSLKYCFCY